MINKLKLKETLQVTQSRGILQNISTHFMMLNIQTLSLVDRTTPGPSGLNKKHLDNHN